MSGKQEKFVTRFSSEILELPCEWEECTIIQTVMESYINHLYTAHINFLSGNDLHCHWKDCEGFTENLDELKRHILLHAFHTKIKCYGRNLQIRKKLPDCLLSIRNRNIIPELPEPLVCCWENCMIEFACAEYFYRHADSHAEHDIIISKKESTICLWQECKRKFSDYHKLKDHLRSHTQEKLVACPTCGGMFASRTKFLDHIQRQQAVNYNENDEIFTCEYCFRKFSSERLLRDHMRHHVNHYKCPYCDMTCPTPSGVQVHIAYRHSEARQYSCQYCDYECKSQNDLRKHLETHSEEPTFKCIIEGCNYASRSQTCFTTHFRKLHEGKGPAKYACHLCDKITTRGNYLTKHLLNFHKFRWPSGHCRFRYDLHADGFYRLQTVRYESLELSQAMMGDNAEDIDNPDPDNINETSPLVENKTLEIVNEPQTKTFNQTTHAIASNSNNNSLLLYLPNESTGATKQCLAAITSSKEASTNGNTSEEQPVLIQLIDIQEDQVSSTDSSLFLYEIPKETKENKIVQWIGQSSESKTFYEAAEIITDGRNLYDYNINWKDLDLSESTSLDLQF